MTLKEAKGWMELIIWFLIQNELLEKEKDANNIRRISTRYLIVDYHLYNMVRVAPMLRCISKEDLAFVMKEVHEGVYGSHIGGRALKILRTCYYWPSML